MNFYQPPSMFGALRILTQDAQQQARTVRDVKGPWVRPKVPNRITGRKGTRRMWKRAHPPHRVFLYREPTDMLVFGDTVIATPIQADALRRETLARSK